MVTCCMVHLSTSIPEDIDTVEMSPLLLFLTCHILQEDKDVRDDAMRRKLRGEISSPVYSLTTLANKDDIASIFEFDPTTITRGDSLVPR